MPRPDTDEHLPPPGVVPAGDPGRRDRARHPGRDPADDVAARSVASRVAAAPAELVRLLVVSLVRDGVDADTADLVLACGPRRARELLEAARAASLLDSGDRLRPAVAVAVAAAAGSTALHDVRWAVLEAELRRGTLGPALACRLAAGGLRDPRLAAALADAGDTVTGVEAAGLYDAAVRAGADLGALAVRRADAALRAGDLETSLAIVDAAWDQVADGELASLVKVGATVSVLRGMPRHAAALYRYLGPSRAGAQAPLAAAVLWGAGDPVGAAEMAAATAAGAPTARSAGLGLLAEGLELSLGPSWAQALTTLSRAATLMHPPDPAPTPVSGAAVAALAALHAGDLDRAEVVLRRAVADPATRGPRRAHHLALLGWTAMLRGDLAGAAELREQGAAVGSPAVRDALFLRALEVGLARRRGDAVGLRAAWSRAGEVLDELTPDLFTLLPLGELWVAAARLQESARLTGLVAEGVDLLERLGEPVLWSAALHWSGVHAAIHEQDPGLLRPHAAALSAASHHSPYAAALAMGGQAWLRVLVGHVDGEEVAAGARALARFGLAWDGARLAGQAALVAADSRVAADLLQVARGLTPGGAAEPGAVPTDGGPGGPLLSEREQEVAALLVQGLTYKDIGARLFISAKTVEHHVARMRRRLGAGSRGELLTMLRATVGRAPG